MKGGLYLALRNTDTEESLDEYLNHSCDANTWLEGETKLVAQRDIVAGEEVTLDQGTWNFDEADYADHGTTCTCEAVSCRGVLTQNDWRRTDVQARSPWTFPSVGGGDDRWGARLSPRSGVIPCPRCVDRGT